MIMQMKFRSYILAFLALVPIVFTSCHKDDDDDVLEYLSGKLTFPLPGYATCDYTKSFLVDTLSTLAKKDGGSVGYYFRNGLLLEVDTVKYENQAKARPFTVRLKDTVGTFSFTLAGFAKDYYGSTQSVSVTVVKAGYGKGHSLTGFDIKDSDEIMQDPRDERSYYVTTIGNTRWMRSNLAWNGSGIPFKKYEAMNDVYGRYYNWEEAKTACPENWTLPSDSDWCELAGALGAGAKPGEGFDGIAGKLMEDIYFNSSKMWPFTREVKIDNSARFSAMPVGYATKEGSDYVFEDNLMYSMFWCSDADSYGHALCRYIYGRQNYVYSGARDTKEFYASVRCIQKINK